MIRLASVELTKLKNVKPNTRLTFSDAGAVFLGRNGTGKTTLLQYLVALCVGDARTFASDEPFDVSARFTMDSGTHAELRLVGERTGDSALPVDSSPDITQFLPAGESTRVEFTLWPPDDEVGYRIEIIDGRAELRRMGETATLCTPFPVGHAQYQLASCVFRLVDLVREPRGLPRGPLAAAAMDLAKLEGALYRHDEGLDYFRMLTDELSSYLDLEIVSRQDGRSALQIRGNVHRFPRHMLDALTRVAPTGPSADFFSASSESIEFLSEFVKMAEFSSATVVAPVEARRISNETVIHNCRSLRFNFDVGTSRISHAKLSFGQKRLLSYLYYLACNTQIGIADELVNGMHHDWIDYCLGTACENRQMFYTSQNPLLLDGLAFDSAEQVSERFVTCEWNEHDGFVWQNLDPQIGREFYRLYQTGIQHVSEILKTKNWW